MAEKSKSKLQKGNDKIDMDNDSKRKRGDVSSVSELDTSTNSPEANKKTKPKKKKSKNREDQTQNITENEIQETNSNDMNEQLKMINHKLSNVLTKDDLNLKSMIKEIVQQMKDELIASVSDRIGVLEDKLFVKEEENETLIKQIDSLNKQINKQNEEYITLKSSTDETDSKLGKKLNEIEQYERLNNVRINGIPERGTENADTTAEVVIETLNSKMDNLNLTKQQIDISHRLGPQINGKHRHIIVKFMSRTTRNNVMSRKRELKGTDIFIAEDLTILNNKVLTSVRIKNQNDIKQTWSQNGKLYYKNEHNHVHEVTFGDYKYWLELDWPEHTEAISEDKNQTVQE